MIPKTIHIVWIGGPIPYEYRHYIEGWRDLHPEWQVEVWRDADLDALPKWNAGLYADADHYAPDDALRFKVDVARLEILYALGGLYVDADTMPLKPIDPLAERYRDGWFVASPNGKDHVTNAIIAAPPASFTISEVIDLLPHRAQRGKRVVDQVGPGPLTEVVRRREQAGQVTVLPARLFGPLSIKDRRKGREPDLTKSYAWHQWANTRDREAQR